MAETYRILDEPAPSKLSQGVVHPMWPLFGLMLAGLWLGLPWFIFNGFASGSPTRRREIAIAAGGLFGCVVTLLAIVTLANAGTIEGSGIQYALLVLSIVKLSMGYWLYVTQLDSFELFQHFGGEVRNGLPLVIVAAFFLNDLVMDAIPWTLVRIILG